MRLFTICINTGFGVPLYTEL